MSDDQQPEELRPIPDGGLKDNMPGWLKRPPAWRNMPSAEQRHERTLPDPDTSEIDPKTLVDVNDLPQWLQTIAARGDVPLPTPDQSVGHALEQIEAVSARSRRPEMIDPEENQMPVDEPTTEGVVMTPDPEIPEPINEPASPVAQDQQDTESTPTSLPIVLGICLLIVVAIVVAYVLV